MIEDGEIFFEENQVEIEQLQLAGKRLKDHQGSDFFRTQCKVIDRLIEQNTGAFLKANVKSFKNLYEYILYLEGIKQKIISLKLCKELFNAESLLVMNSIEMLQQKEIH